jgi:hypothetical protein
VTIVAFVGYSDKLDEKNCIDDDVGGSKMVACESGEMSGTEGPTAIIAASKMRNIATRILVPALENMSVIGGAKERAIRM